MTREPKKNCKKAFIVFSCTNISIEEHIKSRHELKNQEEFKSDFNVVLYYSTSDIIQAGLCGPRITQYYAVHNIMKKLTYECDHW